MPESSALTSDLLLRHEAFVLRLARSLVRDEASAQDVAQETLLAALRHAPPAGSLRGWLARVVRHRASDQRRGERRRGEREAGAARSESQLPATSAAERLELEHGVVRAVLALDEPYRGVVVAVYYEGLAPTDVARRSGVPASTVRAQLSRALEQLRGKLDREHGDRASWGLALVGLLRSREGTAAASGTATAAGSLAGVPPIAVAAVAAVATFAVGAWWITHGPTAQPPVEASAAPLATSAAPRSVPAPAPATEDLRVAAAVPTEPKTEPQAQAGSWELPVVEELTDLVGRTRQLKSAILARRLVVEPDLLAAYAWLEDLPETGVVRLLSREATGFQLDLPWMNGGGAYYSFTERVHDYQRRPQIGLQSDRFGASFTGGAWGAVVDLGQGAFRSLAIGRRGELLKASESDLAALEILRRPVRGACASDGATMEADLRELGRDRWASVVLGHTYLVRAVSDGEFDVLAAIEVAGKADDGVSLAWCVLEQWDVDQGRAVRVPPVSPDSLPPAPTEWDGLAEAELRARLDDLRARAEELLVSEVPTAVAERFAHLHGREDAGIGRLVERNSPFVELPRLMGGGAYWSFESGSNEGRNLDLCLEGGRFKIGLAGRDTGLAVDLGPVPLESAARAAQGRVDDPATELALGPAIDLGLPRAEVYAALGELDVQAGRLLLTRTEAIAGHSYLLRSVMEGRHDVVVVLEVLEKDARGILMAWQVLRSTQAPESR